MLNWITYILGQVVHVLMRAYYSVTNKNNPIQSFKGYVGVYGVAIGVRFFIETMVFWLWLGNPQFLMQILHKFGLSTDITVPINPALAGLYGFGADSFLDFIVDKFKFLKGEVPNAPNGNNNK